MERCVPEYFETIVIGAGQAGLSVGYHLARRDLSFVILDAHDRVGDVWRSRWDSLHLFTPARFDGLDGMPFPAPANHFPTRGEMADYLESYARHFQLSIRSGVRVDGLTWLDRRFRLTAGERCFEADNVVVAMSNYQKPRIPEFALELDPAIVQLHSMEYRNPGQLRDGGVLLVGAGNSGSEIAMELSRSHPVWMSGRDTGHVPFRLGGLAGRLFLTRFVLRFLFHRVLTVGTPVGRKVRPTVLARGGPLIRVKPNDLASAGVRRVPRVAGVRDGRPLLDDGQLLDVANVVWCTGFEPGFSWIHLPVLDGREPMHDRGVVASQPGLYFVGLHFLRSLSSGMIHGVGRDAEHVVRQIAARRKSRERAGDRVSIAASAG
jgi:putative flavoprotein involved in K+ transport